MSLLDKEEDLTKQADDSLPIDNRWLVEDMGFSCFDAFILRATAESKYTKEFGDLCHIIIHRYSNTQPTPSWYCSFECNSTQFGKLKKTSLYIETRGDLYKIYKVIRQHIGRNI